MRVAADDFVAWTRRGLTARAVLRASTLFTSACLAIACVIAGCENTQPTESSQQPQESMIFTRATPAEKGEEKPAKKFPSLLEMRPMAGTAAAELPPGAPARAVPVFIQRLDLRRSESLDRAWKLVEPADVADDALLLWKANGFRIGTVPIARYAEFYAAVPQPLRVINGSLVTADRLLPLQAWNAMLPSQNVTIARSSKDPTATEMIELRRGQYQFLIRVAGIPDGRLRLEIFPHHHSVRQTIRVRDPSEVLQDGTVFRELALQMDLQPDHMLVIAWDLAPWALEPEQAPAPEGEAGRELPPARGEAEKLPPAPPMQQTPAGSPNTKAPMDAPATPPTPEPPASEEGSASPKPEVITEPAPAPDAPRRLGDLILTQEQGRPAQSLFVLVGPGRRAATSQPATQPATQPAQFRPETETPKPQP